MSASKDKGTKWETAVVRYLDHRGLRARRKASTGSKDEGDIELLDVPGIVIEAKNCKGKSLAQWVDEVVTEAGHARVPVGAVWHHRRLAASPGGGYVTMSGDHFANLLAELKQLRGAVGLHPRPPAERCPQHGDVLPCIACDGGVF